MSDHTHYIDDPSARPQTVTSFEICGETSGGDIWRRHLGETSGGDIWKETSGRYLGASGRHLGILEAREVSWRKKLLKVLCFTVFEVATDRFV